jgi:hypothetical protein
MIVSLKKTTGLVVRQPDGVLCLYLMKYPYIAITQYYSYRITKLEQIFLKKNISKALLSEIKVLPLGQQIPPRFPLTSVPGRNFYFIYQWNIPNNLILFQNHP